MLSGALDLTPLHDDLWVPLEVNFSALPAGALPSDPPASVDRSPASSSKAFYCNLAISGR